MLVIKHGNRWQERTCKHCGCVFCTTDADIEVKQTQFYDYAYVSCPECGHKMGWEETPRTAIRPYC